MRCMRKMLSFQRQSPLVRGMVCYGIIWPASSITQEYITHGTTLRNANWAQAARFGIFGSLFMAPFFYGWLKLTSRIFKGKSFKTAVKRALVEQAIYSPVALAYFFFGMSLLESKPVGECVQEVREKLMPAYKSSLLFWPAVQSFNFYFIPERYWIVFVSAASFVWTVYLAQVKMEQDKKKMGTDVKGKS